MVTVTTNNHARPIIQGYELTAKERAEFDYIDWRVEDSASFFRYKGDLHDLGEFSVWTTRPEELRAWDGYRADSFFSALVVRYKDDFESVVVGLVLS
jgi:hypothetical protein